MITELLKVELRKVWAYYAPSLVVMVGYILLRNRPLASIDSVVALIAISQGWILAWRIFNDPGATRSFIFSRPLSRRSIFFTRWVLGLSFQALTIVVLFAVIALGLRSWIQIKIGSPYHPIVQWFELEILWTAGVFSLLAYEIQMFLKLRAEVLKFRPDTWLDTFAKWFPIALTVLFLLLPLFALTMEPTASEITTNRTATLGILAFVFIITILTTSASVHCYRHLEVEA